MYPRSGVCADELNGACLRPDRRARTGPLRPAQRVAGGQRTAVRRLALAGMRSVIPPDEVVEAMLKVGHSLPDTLKETAQGGIAATPTGKRIAKEIFPDSAT